MLTLPLATQFTFTLMLSGLVRVLEHPAPLPPAQQAGARASLHNGAGLSAVLAAAGHGQAGCLSLLLRHLGQQRFGQLAAATDAHGRNSLHFAAASGALSGRL